MTEIPKVSPEKKEIIEDNDRKFILETVDPQFLAEQNARSYLLITDWLETNEADETKVAYKKFDDGNVQILLIAKTTVNGNRTAEKRGITEAEYARYLEHAKVHVEKKRFEFEYTQKDGTTFAVKYDEFVNSSLRVLEVGPASQPDGGIFKSEDFPYKLEDVSDDISYVGFRVAGRLS